jgi:hypothetical protein
MVLSICKYQIPYVQYNLFEDYIAGNLCVNRYDENSTCKGKCFLEKQIRLVDETDSDSGNPEAQKQVKGIDDYVVKEVLLQEPNHLIKNLFFSFILTHFPKPNLNVLAPPPKRFI